jgi:predicted Zn-dependent peptidase
MSRLGKGELLYDELLSVDDVLRRVDAVTPEAVRAVAADLLVRPMSLAVIGPFDNHEFASSH